jgi:threonine/homoserine/homoserine lactone efflux protein
MLRNPVPSEARSEAKCRHHEMSSRGKTALRRPRVSVADIMKFELSLIISGIVLGVPAGFSPGPLQMLIISQTLRHNMKEGIRVAMVPLITDFPIVFMTVFVLSQLSDVNVIMGLISLIGALFLVYLGYGNITVQGIEIEYDEKSPGSISKGIMTNILNPYPYLFWLVVGAPLILKAYHINLFSALLFLGIFYTCLVGAHIGIAVIAEKSRFFLKGKAYIYTLRCLGVALMVFALRFLWESLKFFGIWG